MTYTEHHFYRFLIIPKKLNDNLAEYARIDIMNEKSLNGKTNGSIVIWKIKSNSLRDSCK